MPISLLLETYMAHVFEGQSLRSLAREQNTHASTVMRRVRRVEDARHNNASLNEILESQETALRLLNSPSTSTAASEVSNSTAFRTRENSPNC